MEFPDSWFLDEVRDGFFVAGMMKRAWAAQLEVLEDIDKVCKKHGILWFADCGTLLGAIRHRGFIPWDDDLDICMKREDYNRFLSVAAAELPEGYFLHNIYTDDGYPELFTRVLNSRQINFTKEFLEKFHGCPYGMGIDVFVLDAIAPSPEEEEAQHELISSVFGIVQAMEEGVADGEVQRQVEALAGLLHVNIDPARPLRRQLLLLAEGLCSMFEEAEAKELTGMQSFIQNKSYRMPKEYYRETTRLPFETGTVSVPKLYDAVAAYKFGAYMQQVKSGGTHEYPLYKKQEEALKNQRGENPLVYEISKEDLLICRQRENGIRRLSARQRNTPYQAVFLVCQVSDWSAMESVWRSAKRDPDCTPYVILIPFCFKHPDGSFGMMQDAAGQFPKEVPVVDFRQFHLWAHHPDVIYMQHPYDEYHPAYSVHPMFYTDKLLEATDCLVYVQPFVADECTAGDTRAIEHMKYCCISPGVVRADRVIVQSEEMRMIWIDLLVNAAGEETRKLWEKKILGLGSPIADKKVKSGMEAADLPETWRSILVKRDQTPKRVILFYTGASSLLSHKEAMIEKIKRVLEVFWEKREEIALAWFPEEWEAAEEDEGRKTAEVYHDLVRQYREKGFGILVSSADLEQAAGMCNAYYGDRGYAAQLCIRRHVPVLIWKVEI